MAASETELRGGKASALKIRVMHTTDAILRVPRGAVLARAPGDSQVEIVVPVRNEESGLEPAVRRLRAFLDGSFPFAARITIADNGSTDRTWAQALVLAAEFPLVHAVRIERPGRGGALRTVWTGSDADIYAYMDVDLSTDLNALLPLVAPLLSGHSDVAIGTRLARGARVIRGPKREIISRGYNLLLHASLGTRFSDAQCGFKAIRADAARVLLPLTADTGWFFDTELLVLAERAGLRIHEVPVDWIDDSDSRVNVVATALGDLRGIVRLRTGLARGTISVPALRGAGPPGRRLASQLTRFVLVGVASTVASLLLYLLLRGVPPAQAATV
jgi:glycosyltransferase involved in cell wall biosynthesis